MCMGTGTHACGGQVTDMLRMKEKDSNYEKLTIIRNVLFWVIMKIVVVISYCLKQRYQEHEIFKIEQPTISIGSTYFK